MFELDPRQARAVDAGPTELFIEAGAGSGKTHVLTARFVSAVTGAGAYPGCAPGDVLAVTFTDKAAAELSERIRRALITAGEDAAAREIGDAWISTIHGMCSRLLREHALTAGLDPQFRVLDQVEAGSMQAEVLEHVLRERLAVDEGLIALLDAFGFESVARAVVQVRELVRAMGLDISDLARVDPAACSNGLNETATALEEVIRGLRSLRQTGSVTTAADVLAGAARSIREAVAAGLPDAGGLLDALSGKGMRDSRSIEGYSELLAEGRQLLDEARSFTAQHLAAPLEGALVDLAAAFDRRYADTKRLAGAVDFDDLQLHVAHLLETEPAIAEEYRTRFSMLMLDEFQDTNELQLRIVRALSSGNLCTVGDENQSIYSFRHADVDVFRDWGRRTREHRRLDINYRIAPPLLEALNDLFGQPSLLGPSFMPLSPPPSDRARPPWPEAHARLDIRLVDASEANAQEVKQAEAEAIAERVRQMLDGGFSAGDVVVLLRALRGGRGARVESALAARGIKATLSAAGEFFQRREVMEAIALLRVIDNVRDDEALVAVLAGRFVGLDADSLVRVRSRTEELAAERAPGTPAPVLWEALTTPHLGLPDADAAAVHRLVAAVDRARDLRGLRSLRETVVGPLLDLDLDLVLYAAERESRSWANLMRLGRIAEEYERAVAGDLAGFLRYLEIRQAHSVGEQEAVLDGESDAVRIMSIHAAKGLEFPVVIVGALDSGATPGSIAVGRVDGRPMLGLRFTPDRGGQSVAHRRVTGAASAAAEAEATRLLYVACTRAMEGLTIVAPVKAGQPAGEGVVGDLRRALGLGEAVPVAGGEVMVGRSVAALSLLAPGQAGGDPGGRDEDGRRPSASCPAAAVEALPRTRPPAALTAPPGVPRRVSYSSLATFERCAYRFFLSNIMRLPASPESQAGEAPALGTAVHAVLEQAVAPGSVTPEMIERAAGSVGLSTAATRRLRAAVSSYLSSPVAEEVFAAASVAREVPITVPIAGTVLAGAIDVLCWSGERALIVDYKTGESALSEADARARYRLQGECYALAAFEAGASAVRVVFAELERGRATEYMLGPSDRGQVVAHIASLIGRMESGQYPHLADYERGYCDTCPGLGGMCPVTRPGGGAG